MGGFLNIFSDHPEIAYGIIIVLVGVVSYLFKRIINRMDDDIKNLQNKMNIEIGKLQEDVADIKENYMDRFDNVKNHITTKHEELLDRFSDIRVLVEKQASICTLIQEQKKK